MKIGGKLKVELRFGQTVPRPVLDSWRCTLFLWGYILTCPLLLRHNASPLLLQISPIITEVENISGDQRLFPATFLSEYLTGCISLYCFIGGNHGIDAHVLVPQTDEWCELPHLLLLEKCMPHLGPSTSQGQTLVLAGLCFSPSSDELERSSSPFHSHFLCLLRQSPLFNGC